MAENKYTGGISVDTEHIFPIIKKWLYSEKDIFLPLKHQKIYQQKDISYWDDLEHNIRQHCDMFHIPCRIYFHHGSFKP